MAKMDNKIMLTDFLDDFTKSNVDYKEVAYGLFADLKEKNKNLYYANMDPKNIRVNYTNNRQVSFDESIKFDLGDKEEMIQKNIQLCAVFCIGMFLKYPWQNGLLNIAVLKENFDSCVNFIPQEDVDYYKRVICNGELIYYCDYCDLKTKNAQKKVNSEEILLENKSTNIIQPTTTSAFSTSAFLVISISTMCGLMMVLAYVLAKF